MPRGSAGLPLPARLRSRLGLRTKIIILFAAIGLILSSLLGTITYFAARQLLLDDREAIAVEQAAGDGRLVFTALRGGQANPAEVLASLRPPTRSTPMLLRDAQWFAASLQVRPEDLPHALTSMVEGGTPALQRTTVNGVPVLVIGFPLPDDAGAYLEVFSLADVRTILSTLQRVLILAGAVATVAGVVLGGWMAGRVLRPLREVTEVASRIAEGELDTRLDEQLDRDLTVLSGAFNRMADTLQARIAREARFASDVAHELRTPITSLVTSLAVIEGRRPELSEQGREALGILSDDVQRLQHTVADLTEMAKHDAGVVTADLELYPVPALIGGILNRLHRHDIRADFDQGALRALIRADERRLERIIANLIENADTHGGGVMRLAVRSGQSVVTIAVEDEGPGVPEAERSRIFERFSRGSSTYRSARVTGSGLGLSLAAENTALQRGRIWVEDRPGGGARFVVELEAETA